MTLFVDTSVWSLALRRDVKATEREVQALKDALLGDDVVVTTEGIDGVRSWCARQSWRGPAGVSPVQVRGSARLIASVASCSVTATAKRTQRSNGVWD